MGRCRRFLALLLSLALLSGCARRVPKQEDETLHILATTYPIYLFTTAVVGDTEGVDVDLLVNAQTSCLHDYTLTVKDMKAIEQADVIIMNGAGLEDFMADALAHSDATVIDCSENITLLPTLEHEGHDGHDHEEEYDPHYWMDPNRAEKVMEHIAAELSELDASNAALYQAGVSGAIESLRSLQDHVLEVLQKHLTPWRGAAQPYFDNPMTSYMPSPLLFWPKLITFHDGFQYFAYACGLDLLKAIEEEEGATASAAEIKEITALIEENHIPAIFVEKNGSRKTADVIARETGCKVYELDMLMSGNGEGIQPYIDAIDKNLTTILEAFS